MAFERGNSGSWAARLHACAALLLFLTAAGAAAATASKGGSAPADFRADIKVLQQFLDRDKSYSGAERAEAQTELDALRNRAAQLTPAAFELAVAHVAALTRNGHTMLIPAWPHRFNRVPVRYYLFADGLFIIHTPEGMRDLRGARVLSIDGHDVNALKKVFARYSGAIAPRRDQLIGYFLESPDLLHAAGVAKNADRVGLDLQLQNGRRITRTVQAKIDPPTDDPFAFFRKIRLVEYASENTKSVPPYLAEPERTFRISSLPRLNAYFIQLRANVSIGDQKIEDFVKRAANVLQQAKPKDLVVDLRLDGGGDLNTTRAFIKSLPSLIPDDGRIFAIASGRTFSAGIASLGYLKQAGARRVTIVGEPVGDHLEFWAEGDVMTLPVSGAMLLYATERHNYITGCPEPDCHRFIRENPIRVKDLDPDIPTPLTYGDYRAGRDPALDAVRTTLKR